MLVAFGGLLACSSPAAKPTTPTDDRSTNALVRTWIIADHVLVKGASISHDNATGFHGRTIDITANGFMSPWQGTCERQLPRTERERRLADVISELGVI